MNLAFALIAAACLARAEPAMLEDVRVTARQVTLRLSRPVGFRASSAAAPAAVVLTLEDTRISEVVKDKSVASALVAGIAALPLTTAEGESARVIIKLAKRRDFNTAWNGNDLLVDLLEPATAQAAALAPPPASSPAPAPDRVPATVTPAPRAKAGPLYRVQVGSFPAEAAAAELKKALEGKAGPVEVRRVDVGGKPMFRVLVGAPQARSEAQKLAAKLKKLGQAGFLNRE